MIQLNNSLISISNFNSSSNYNNSAYDSLVNGLENNYFT